MFLAVGNMSRQGWQILCLLLSFSVFPWTSFASFPAAPDSSATAMLRVVATGKREDSSRHWEGYLGPLKLSEREFFLIAGDLEKAEEARKLERKRRQRGLEASWVAAVGAVLLLYAKTEDEDKASTIAVPVVSLAALSAVRLLLLPDKSATIAEAKAAAEAYNRQVRRLVQPDMEARGTKHE